MDLKQQEVTSEAFRRFFSEFDPDDILECHELAAKLVDMAGEPAGLVVYCAATMMLHPREKRAPFKPLWRTEQGTSARVGDFNSKTMLALANATPHIKNHELRARLADLVWLEVRDKSQPDIAVNAYIQSAKQLFQIGRSFPAFTRLERALRLVSSLRNLTDRTVLHDYVKELLATDDLLRSNVNLLRLCWEYGIKEDDFIYAKALETHEHFSDRKQYRTAVSVLEIALKSCHGDKPRTYQIFHLIAECHEAEARLYKGSIAASCYMQAIEALERIPETRPKRDELYRELREAQRAIQHEMGIFSHSLGNLREYAEQAIKIVEGADVYDSIFRLALIISKPSDLEVHKAAVASGLDPLLADFGGHHIDHEGMTVGITPSAIQGEEAHADVADAWAMQSLRNDHRVEVNGRILPALESIASKYYFHDEILDSFLARNPVVPDGHQEFFSRGLRAGLNGDFLEAAHYLIPQLENSLRYRLKQFEREPSKQYPDKSQERDGLKALLDDEVIIADLGAPLLGNLRAILLDKVYGDMRNYLSHGYAPADFYKGDAAVMLWWLVLRMVIGPYISFWEQKYGDNFRDEVKSGRFAFVDSDEGS
ncbi:hypothetical protein PsdCFBP2356_22920 [Pseudomonas syringae pv. dysoxyli]|uniref:DUF7380 domain-containing protein n=1 Tax=Pseudomonas syringae TaxID=317 RepID=UPI0013737715|nr:hypothetical protein [Pseudomonas syringae]NAO29344.1 hypothetical protein [Pseudomonas syringae pv. dysoxyli]